MASAKAKIRHLFGDTFSCRAAPPDILVKLSGSDVLAVKDLKVIFHLNVGNLPSISAHTCSGIIDLPSGGYVSYHDFQSQLDALLKNPESWKFHLV